MEFRQVFYIQELDTYQFLCPGEFGDVDLTPRISEAGFMYSLEEAQETAEMFCDNFEIWNCHKYISINTEH